MNMRSLYVLLLRLHPPAFLDEFAAEMLWLFEETRNSDSNFLLCIDCFVSLAHQWILLLRSWKLVVALMGACLQFTIGGLIWIVFRQNGRAHESVALSGGTALELLMRLIAWASCGIVLMVAGASVWMRSFVRRRRPG